MGMGTRAAIIRETALCLKSWKRSRVRAAGRFGVSKWQLSHSYPVAGFSRSISVPSPQFGQWRCVRFLADCHADWMVPTACPGRNHRPGLSRRMSLRSRGGRTVPMERRNAPVAGWGTLAPKLQGFECPLIQGDCPARARWCLVLAERKATVCKVDIAPLQGADRVVSCAGFEASVTKGRKARETERPHSCKRRLSCSGVSAHPASCLSGSMDTSD